MTTFIESLYKETLRTLQVKDEEEIVLILEIIQEAKDEGETCEVFFLDEYPEVEGWCKYLEGLGYACTYSCSSGIGAWIVSWGNHTKEVI